MEKLIMILILIAEYVPYSPMNEIFFGTENSHDGIWDALIDSEGFYICCGYMADQAWIGRIAPGLQIAWQRETGDPGINDEALAVAEIAVNLFAVAGNSRVSSPGTRHWLEDANGWLLLMDESGSIMKRIDLSDEHRRVVLDVTAASPGELACCGMEFSEDGSSCYGWFGIFSSEGEAVMSLTFQEDSIASFSTLEFLSGRGFLLGGTARTSPSFTVVLLDTGGNILWDTRCGPENTDISARDLLSLDNELCLVVGGGLFDTPLAVMIDLNTGEVVEELLMDEWFTLYACEVRGGVPLCLGHNMLCDGADSETYIIGFYSDSDNHFPLRVIGNGACRCRSFVCSDGETIFIGGEMSECWGGHQNIWLVETVPADWGSEDGGSRMNAAFDLGITEGDDW